MGRNADWQPMRSQRATAEVRGLETQVSELKDKLVTLEREKKDAMDYRNSAQRRMQEQDARIAELEQEVNPSLYGKATQIADLKEQSDSYYGYGHVKFFTKMATSLQMAMRLVSSSSSFWWLTSHSFVTYVAC